MIFSIFVLSVARYICFGSLLLTFCVKVHDLQPRHLMSYHASSSITGGTVHRNTQALGQVILSLFPFSTCYSTYLQHSHAPCIFVTFLLDGIWFAQTPLLVLFHLGHNFAQLSSKRSCILNLRICHCPLTGSLVSVILSEVLNNIPDAYNENMG